MTRPDAAPRTRTLTALLVAAAFVVPALLRPAPARAQDCCTYSQNVWYYADASHTPPAVGFCEFNEACSGQDLCSGTQTDYYIAGNPGCCIFCPN